MTPPARYMLGRHHFSFISTMAAGITQRPKVLLDVDCSNLLMGGSEQYENFSPTCWLEDHLHRFGGPMYLPQENNTSSSSYEFHGVTELEASSSSADLDESFEDFSAESADEHDTEMPGTSGSSSSNPMNNDGDVINLHRYPYVDYDMSIIQPPPYPNEPPPSYEEAIAGSSFLEGDNSDFLW